MKSVFWLLLLIALVAAGWINRDKLHGLVGKSATAEEAATPNPQMAVASIPAAPQTKPLPTSAALPSTPSPPVQLAEVIRKYRDSFVFASGANGAGSGFIANMNGKTFLLTNAHVAAGIRGAPFKTLQRPAIRTATAAAAVGCDIVAMQTEPTSTPPFEIMRNVENEATLGDDVAVLSNAAGGSEINSNMGHIVEIGPDIVVIDAPFVPVDSGGPIIHLKTSKVIGVATFLSIRRFDLATRKVLADPLIRRFGYRIDTPKTWQPINWPAFQAQAAELDNIEKLTKDFIALIKDMAENGQVNPAAHTNPAIASHVREWQADKSKHLSPSDRVNSNRSFVSFLKTTSQADVISAQPRMTYDFFQRQLADQQRERAEIASIFPKFAESAN